MKNRIKKVWLWLGLLVIFLILLWRGPKVTVDEEISRVTLPEDLEEYLQRSESLFPDIRPGAEKKIVWANPLHREKTPVSLVYLHGFTATRQETAPLLDLVGQHLGANIYYTRLTGHGRGGEALLDVSGNDWLKDAEEAWEIGRRIGDQVIIVGTSTGATLAAWLAARKQRDNLLACVMLSPNFGLHDRRSELFLYPWANIFVPWFTGQWREREPLNEAEAHYWTNKYPAIAMLPMMGLVDRIRRIHFAALEIPLLMMLSPHDVVIDTEAAGRIFQAWGSPKKQLLLVTNTTHPSHHVIVGDAREPQNNDPLSRAILDFVKPLIHPQEEQG